MTRQKLSPAAQYLLDTIERLDQNDYRRLIGSRFRRELTEQDLIYLRDLANEELSRRFAQSSPSEKNRKGIAPPEGLRQHLRDCYG